MKPVLEQQQMNFKKSITKSIFQVLVRQPIKTMSMAWMKTHGHVPCVDFIM